MLLIYSVEMGRHRMSPVFRGILLWDKREHLRASVRFL